MGGLLSLVWPSSILPFPSLIVRPQLTEREDGHQDILLAAIGRVNPRFALYTELAQNLPLHLSLRRIMDDEKKRRRNGTVEDESEDSDGGNSSTYSEEDSDTDCSIELESESEEEEEDERSAPAAKFPEETFKFLISDQEVYSRLRDDVYGKCGGRSERNRGVLECRRNVELGGCKGRGGRPAMGDTTKTTMVNRVMPNRRRQVTKEHTKFFCCHFMQRQQQLVIGSQDEQVRFYGRKCIGKYELDRIIRVPYTGWSILDVAISGDGNMMAYSTWSDNIFIARLEGDEALGGWIENGETIPDGNHNAWKSIHVPPDARNRMAVFCLRFTEDGRELLCGGADDRVHLIDVEREKRTLALWSHEDDVNSVAWGDSNNNLIFTAGDDGLCKVWDRRVVASGSADEESLPVGTFAGHKDGITCVEPRGDGHTLLTNSKDQTIKIWDLRRFSSSDAVSSTRSAVSRQQWDYRWQPYPQPKKMELPIQGDTSLATLRGHSVLHTLVRAHWSPPSTGTRYIYTGCARGEVVVYDTLEGRPVERLQGHRAVVRDCIWTGDSNEILTTSWDGSCAVWQWGERKKWEKEMMQEEDGAVRLKKLKVKLAQKRRRVVSRQ